MPNKFCAKHCFMHLLVHPIAGKGKTLKEWSPCQFGCPDLEGPCRLSLEFLSILGAGLDRWGSITINIGGRRGTTLRQMRIGVGLVEDTNVHHVGQPGGIAGHGGHELLRVDGVTVLIPLRHVLSRLVEIDLRVPGGEHGDCHLHAASSCRAKHIVILFDSSVHH